MIYGASTDLAKSNPIRYRGYYYDRETGLYYLNARYYNPQWRRFISPDSTAYIATKTFNGLNLYCYCGNEPINRFDRTGHKWINVVWNWITDTAGSIANFCADFFGAGIVLENKYEMFEAHTIFGFIEAGECYSKTLLGDVSKPCSVFLQKAHNWWVFTEYKIGIQFNIGDGGFRTAIGFGETEFGISLGGGWQLEVISGINKVGLTLTSEVNFGTHEGGHYWHAYLRPVPIALALAVLTYCLCCVSVPAIATAVIVV